MKRILLLLVVSAIFSSCASIKVKSRVPYNDLQTINKMLLFPVMIGEIKLPVFPLIDAAMYYSNVNNIADQIMDAQKKTVDIYRETAAIILEKYFNCDVLYGESLQNEEGYKELMKTHNFKSALRVENDNFPIIITSTGDINPYNFNDGNVNEYFRYADDYRQTVQHICEELNADALAISYSRLDVVGVGMFGLAGNIRLDTYLYIFDKNGNTIAYGYAYSKPIYSDIRVSEYTHRLNDYYNIFDLLANKLVHKRK